MNKISLQNTILFDNMSAILVKFDCIVNMALLNVSELCLVVERIQNIW